MPGCGERVNGRAAFALACAVNLIVHDAVAAVFAQLVIVHVDVIVRTGVMLAAAVVQMGASFVQQLAADRADPLGGDAGIVAALAFEVAVRTDAGVPAAEAAELVLVVIAKGFAAAGAGVVRVRTLRYAELRAAVRTEPVVQTVIVALVAVIGIVAMRVILQGAADLTGIMDTAFAQMQIFVVRVERFVAHGTCCSPRTFAFVSAVPAFADIAALTQGALRVFAGNIVLRTGVIVAGRQVRGVLVRKEFAAVFAGFHEGRGAGMTAVADILGAVAAVAQEIAAEFAFSMGSGVIRVVAAGVVIQIAGILLRIPGE